MKAGSSSRRLVADQSDFVVPSYGWRGTSADQGALAAHQRRSRLQKCIARRSELEIENTRIAAELSRTRAPGVTLQELSPEMRRLLRKLGALAIELAEIDRELAMLAGGRDADRPGIPAAFCGVPAR